MSDAEQPEPPAVLKARRRSRTATLGFVAISLAIFPLIFASKTFGFSADTVIYAYIGLMALGAYMAPWRKYSQDLQTIQEHHRHVAQRKLGITSKPKPPKEDSNDPLAALANRVLTLAGDDAAISGLVETVMARRADLRRDLSSLDEALAMEAAMDSEDNPRHARLNVVAEARRDDLKHLSDALRDLHVELTVRSDADHTEAVRRVDDLLASLSAETELAALDGGTDDAAPSRQEEAPRRPPPKQRYRDL